MMDTFPRLLMLTVTALALSVLVALALWSLDWIIAWWRIQRQRVRDRRRPAATTTWNGIERRHSLSASLCLEGADGQPVTRTIPVRLRRSLAVATHLQRAPNRGGSHAEDRGSDEAAAGSRDANSSSQSARGVAEEWTIRPDWTWARQCLYHHMGVAGIRHAKSLLIIAHNPLLRDGIAGLLNEQSDMTAKAIDPEWPAAQSAVVEAKPQLILLDSCLGACYCRQLREVTQELRPTPRVIVMDLLGGRGSG